MHTRIILGHVEIPEKTNEIPMAQWLIQSLGLPEGSIYTLDAMHCQKKHLKQLKRSKGNSSVQIKENQKELYRETQEACNYLKPLSTFISPVEKGRNRIEERTAEVFQISDCLIESSDWKKYLACVIRVKRYTQIFETKSKT